MPSVVKMVLGNGPLGPSFAPWIRQHSGIQKYWSRWSNLYKQAAGYRQKGYLLDDLIPEETALMQKAISRLPEKAGFDRVFRQRQGLIQSALHKELPKEKWTTAQQDERYLTPYIEQVLAEDAERAEWDHHVVEKIQKRRASKKSPFERY
ncbi:hypothetical protein L202_02245 [Cryptococcus amylolentus CBS 6039]|uniref:Complex III subunit 7 n=2 Tax=Cryptococcus amylolentus TaxID=104669 RepID=A0A1E3I019_9TREE|nr:hypothetical protein L202_02245 [Cryptococcus amylolentus CBS 6039]ODN81897.1 hypothetical protein L202_02245 [Cryptococcus amylolentus CBS 6039]ODO09947.1 hypothetical protein I350_02170 [Cryptococcus amylolentus CBS 6273]